MDLLEDVRRDIAKFVGDSGVCADDERVLETINDARRVLYPLGDWKGTTEPLCICPFACGLTLPAEFSHAKTAFICRTKMVVENDWFVRMSGGFEEYCGAGGTLVQLPGEFVTFRDWPTHCVPGKPCCAPEGFYVELVFEDDRDCGVEISLEGIGAERRKVSLTRTLNQGPFNSQLGQPGETRMVQLRHIIKPKMYGRLRLYGNDGANRILLALYDPDDINPHFTRYSFPRTMRGPLLLKAKKKFVKYEDNPKQFVDISTDALIHTAQALTDRASRNIVAFNANLNLAIGYLDRELSGPQSTSTSPMRMATAYRVGNLMDD